MKTDFRDMKHYVAIDNCCAWPNLTILKDGSVGALIFNQPSHGRVEGDIELWVSADGWPPWRRRSRVTHHLPGTVRMNVAGGQGTDGILIALVSGWQLSQPRPIRTENILEVWVCRSRDSGYNWEVTKTFEPPPGTGKLVPFGNVRLRQDGVLFVPAYDCRMKSPSRTTRKSSSYIFRSNDNGLSWGNARIIGIDSFTETDILQKRDGHWLAAARTLQDYAHPANPHSEPWIVLFCGDREAEVWKQRIPLTLPGQHPGNLLRLIDGRILFTYGSRISGNYGVFVRVSEDEGKSWSLPQMLVGDLCNGDCGYPSTVQLENGMIVTAYYAKEAIYHRNYHMAVVRWTFINRILKNNLKFVQDA